MKTRYTTRLVALLASLAVTMVLLETVALTAHPALEPTTLLAAANTAPVR